MMKLQIINEDPAFNDNNEVNSQAIVQSQWGSSNFLSNTDMLMKGVPPSDSIANNNITSEFVTQPEFGYFLRDQYEVEYDTCHLSQEQAAILLNTELGDNQSLLNPMNMRFFFYQYEMRNYPTLMGRFKLNSPAQVDAVYLYLNYMVKDFLK